MGIRNILVVSDLHCGSIYGLLPEGFVTADAGGINQNPGQKYLWECWQHLAGEVAKLDIHAVVVNGDAIDGEQRKSKGDELCVRLHDQPKAAIQCLKVLGDKLKAPKWYFVTGTPYHEVMPEVEVIAEGLKGVPYTGAGPGRLTRRTLDLDIDGVVVNFHHGIPGGGGNMYRATAIDKEAMFSALAGKQGKLPKADAVVRSHLHFFAAVQHTDKWAVITPCWELQTGYMSKNSPYRMLPDIGAVVISVDPEAKRAGEDPIGLRKFIYKLPPVKVTKL